MRSPIPEGLINRHSRVKRSSGSELDCDFPGLARQILDAELGKHLAGYVQTHQQTASTLAKAKATMEAAAKATQEEVERKAEERKKAA